MVDGMGKAVRVFEEDSSAGTNFRMEKGVADAGVRG